MQGWIHGAVPKGVAAAVASALIVLVIINAQRPSTNERCEGQGFELRTAPGGLSPYIDLALDGRRGSFLLDYGSTRSSVSELVFGAPGGSATLHGFSLPTFPSGRFDVAKYWSDRQPSGGQLGVVGTDFLSQLTADFRFRNGGGDVVIGDTACTPDSIAQRGFFGIRQAGFFSSDTLHVAAGRPNVPILYLNIAGLSIPSQIDTGYDDIDARPSIDINEALYQRLIAAGVQFRSAGRIGVATCAGQEAREALVAPRADIFVATETGVLVRKLQGVTFDRKKTNACGGIASMPEPAAQLGVSIIAQLGAVVFDPKAETVWVARRLDSN